MDVLTLRDNARQQLVLIKDVETGIEYLNKVKAIETWAKAEKKDAELQNMIAEQKIRTQRVLGRLIQEGQQRGEIARAESGGRGANQYAGVDCNDTSKPKTLSNIGITRNQSSVFKAIASIPDDRFERSIAERKEAVNIAVNELTTTAMFKVAQEIKKEQRDEAISQRDSNLQASEMPLETYEIIYCDPPWQYNFSSTDNRKIENQYPTMTIEQLCEMELPKTTDDALLLMWATAPKLIEAITLIQAWGFNYKTHCIWDKEIIGMGYWFRGQHELLLIATKGNFSPPGPEHRTPSIYTERRQKHSAKPEYFYDWIEKAFGDRKRIELFSRTIKNGWYGWGNE